MVNDDDSEAQAFQQRRLGSMSPGVDKDGRGAR